jgi:hypothetical protein
MADIAKPVNKDTAIALIGKDIGYIQGDISEIKESIKCLSGVFSTKEELSQNNKETNIRLTSLEEKRSFWKYTSPILTAVLSATITFLLIEYIKGA